MFWSGIVIRENARNPIQIANIWLTSLSSGIEVPIYERTICKFISTATTISSRLAMMNRKFGTLMLYCQILRSDQPWSIADTNSSHSENTSNM